MNTYSILEASKKLGISVRVLQKRCKSSNIRKKDNRYLITDLLIKQWQKEIAANERQTNTKRTPNERTNAIQLDIEVESLKHRIKQLENQLQQYENTDKNHTEPSPKQSTIDSITKEFQILVDNGGNPNLLDKKIIFYEAIEREKE